MVAWLRSLSVVAVVAGGVVLVAACGNSAEDACEKLNDLCGSKGLKADCSKASDNYDKLSDAEKDKADKAADCIDDAPDCMGALACLSTNGVGTPGTSSSGGATPAGCDSSKCFPGNECLPLDGVEECRKTCTSNDNPATSCPFNYNCVSTDPDNDVKPFCVETTARTNDGEKIEKKDSGQWGSPCQANLGSKNPACDTEQGFYCYGISPTDGNAYCTRYGCESDLECGAGFACVDVNTTPNVSTSKKKEIGATTKVCLRRAYCSPCTVDLDCNAIEGTKQHCLVDAAGRGFCTPECSTSASCNNEAKCVTAQVAVTEDHPDGQAKVCYPRSKVCVGNGSLCSSCLVDTDCGDDGMCTHGQFTTEKFCIKKAPGGDCAKCPKELTSPARKIGCSTKADDLYPAGYCLGLYAIGGQVGADIGCWTPDR